MAGFLDLRNAKRIWHGGQEVTQLWAGGVAWAKPNTVLSMADYYGTGAGQIPLDLRLDDPTVSGSLVTGARNDGGAGVSFNATATANREPTKGSNFITFSVSAQRLGLASGVNLNGTHLFVPLCFPVNASGSSRFPRPIYKGATGLFVELTSATGRVGTRAASGHPLATTNLYMGDAWAFNQWMLLEFRYADGTLSVFKNGQMRASINAAMADFALDTIGGSSSSNALYFGDIGRCVGLITNGGNEPAIPVIRNLLASQYGFSLS